MTQDPIEYLKSAYADGDLIEPETMLRDCFGVIKTERVIVGWSDEKPKIKVGDKVRLLRGGGIAPLLGFHDGSIYKVADAYVRATGEKRLELSDGECTFGYASPEDVERI